MFQTAKPASVENGSPPSPAPSSPASILDALFGAPLDRREFHRMAIVSAVSGLTSGTGAAADLVSATRASALALKPDIWVRAAAGVLFGLQDPTMEWNVLGMFMLEEGPPLHGRAEKLLDQLRDLNISEYNKDSLESGLLERFSKLASRNLAPDLLAQIQTREITLLSGFASEEDRFSGEFVRSAAEGANDALDDEARADEESFVDFIRLLACGDRIPQMLATQIRREPWLRDFVNDIGAVVRAARVIESLPPEAQERSCDALCRRAAVDRELSSLDARAMLQAIAELQGFESQFDGIHEPDLDRWFAARNRVQRFESGTENQAND